jgi:hypothetical protein
LHLHVQREQTGSERQHLGRFLGGQSARRHRHGHSK